MIFSILGLIIGGVIGGNFFGGLIGYFVGGCIDSLFEEKVRIRNTRTSHNDFLDSFLILAAYVVKLDGHFVRSELNYIKNYLVHTLGPEQAVKALNRLNEIIRQNYNVQAVCFYLQQSSNIHERLLIIQFLFGLAHADGNLQQVEIQAIGNIAQWMGISRGDFESIKSMFTHASSTDENFEGDRPLYQNDPLTDDYKILECSPDMTDEEVKKSYRSLAKKYHPDRVAHLGENARKAAEEKFSRLGQAYDNIKKERGMK